MWVSVCIKVVILKFEVVLISVFLALLQKLTNIMSFVWRNPKIDVTVGLKNSKKLNFDQNKFVFEHFGNVKSFIEKKLWWISCIPHVVVSSKCSVYSS